MQTKNVLMLAKISAAETKLKSMELALIRNNEWLPDSSLTNDLAANLFGQICNGGFFSGVHGKKLGYPNLVESYILTTNNLLEY